MTLDEKIELDVVATASAIVTVAFAIFLVMFVGVGFEVFLILIVLNVIIGSVYRNYRQKKRLRTG